MKEFKKQKGDPKGRKYRCGDKYCKAFVFFHGSKLEPDERVYCDNHTPKH